MKKNILITFILILISFQFFVGTYYNPFFYIEKEPNDFIFFIKKMNQSKFDKILYEKKDEKYHYFVYQNGMFTHFNYINYHKFKIDVSLIDINNIKEGEYLSDFCHECEKRILFNLHSE
jgi:hypothetical protein